MQYTDGRFTRAARELGYVWQCAYDHVRAGRFASFTSTRNVWR